MMMTNHSRIKINWVPFMNALRENNFTGSDEDKYLLQLVEDWLINEKFVSPEFMTKINHTAIKWLVNKGKTTYIDYVNQLATSKAFKDYNIPVDQLREKSKKMIEEFNEMFNSLASMKRIKGDN